MMPMPRVARPPLERQVEDLRELGLYDIAFRKAGVGLIFFEPPDDGTIGWRELAEDADEFYRRAWKQYLRVDRYYPTFVEAVEAEWLSRKGV